MDATSRGFLGLTGLLTSEEEFIKRQIGLTHIVLGLVGLISH